MTQGYLEEDFSNAWAQCCSYLKSNGSFTGKEVRKWTESLDTVLCRKVLQILIQVKWTDYGEEGATSLEENKIAKIIRLGNECDHTPNEISRQILFELAQSAPARQNNPSE